MLLSDFQYDLPESLIARYPAEPRSASRLLHLDGSCGEVTDRQFRDLPQLLRPGDVLVVNDTRVVPARLFGTKETGGRVEIMLERLAGGSRAIVQLRASKTPKAGSRIAVAGGATAVVAGREGEFWVLEFDAQASVVFDQNGEIPLPPYIDRPADLDDRERYQTVYARAPGAVAAPTAGLHFDAALLERCRAAGAELAPVTLHVGAGTFQPVRVTDVAEHRMHAERLVVSADTVRAVKAARARGSRVVGVGTTAVRALETAAAGGFLAPYDGETRLFIKPGDRFRVVDALVTNFHLPESTLLMLVCAFGGQQAVLRAYRHAVAAGYRFFSYGDAMFIEPAPTSLEPRVPA
jgi:S-adenosylmethionine:tRNA ribosyltransferase-isomerase